MSVVTGHTCNAGGYSGSRPKEERQRDCRACQSLAASRLEARVLEIARSVLRNSQPVEHQHCICAACEDRVVSALQSEYERGKREAAERCAEICCTEEVLLPISAWETRHRVSAETALELGRIIRSEFGLSEKGEKV